MSVNAEKSKQKAQTGQTSIAAPIRKTPEHCGPSEAVLALQRAAGNRAVANLLGDRGRSLDPATRKEAEARFGEEFGDVRVHADGDAARTAEALGANAWTEGRDIAFASGKYSPSTSSGKHVLAHELAHVVQQRRGGAKPATFDRSSAAEIDAAGAASQFAGGRGHVSVNAASGAGVARQESDEPWWKRRLNPLYQKALKVLPAGGAAALEQANEFARGVVSKYGASDQDINQVVDSAEPIIQPVEHALGVKSVSADTPVPDPTPFETQLNAGKPFTQQVHTRPDIDPSKAMWLGSGPKPSVDQLKQMRFEDPNNPATGIWVDEGKTHDVGIFPDSVTPIRNPRTREVKGYRARKGDTMTELDRSGQLLGSRNLENPLETPLIDPIDVAMLGADVGPALAKGISAGGKALVEWAAKSGARELGEVGTEEGTSVLARAASGTLRDFSGDLIETGQQKLARTEVHTLEDSAAANIADTEQAFGELHNELQGVQEGAGELKGTSSQPLGFESPQPLQLEGSPVIRTLEGKPVRESGGAAFREGTFQSASAQTRRSMNTAIHADVGESEAYKEALKKGEIGLQRPGGVNVRGVDFITAVDGPDGIKIMVNDAKASVVGKFPKPKGPAIKEEWRIEVDQAINRLDLGDPALEARIRAAAADPKNIQLRQINVDYSPSGKGGKSGF